MIERDVYGLYAGNWGNDLVEQAYSHPAKVQPLLAAWIIERAIKQGYIAPGMTVVDPFAGIAGFALSCMRHGLHYRGVELEARFCELGRDNIALWNERYAASFPTWGTAQIIRGDSRQLASVLQGAGAVVSSPPYAEGAQHQGGADPRPEHITGGVLHYVDYGRTPGQLGAMPEGDASAVLNRERENIIEIGGLVYLLLFSPKDEVAFLLEIAILPSVLSDLSRLGVPVFTVDLNNEMKIRQEKIAMVIGDFELPDVFDFSNFKKSGEGVFEFALPGFSVASYGTVDATTVLNAMGLHAESTPTGRALALNFSSSGDGVTVGRAKLSDTALGLGRSNAEILSALLTRDDLGSDLGFVTALNRTVACPLFCVAPVNGKVLPASIAGNRNPIPPRDITAFPGTESSPSFGDLIGLSIERLRTQLADPVVLDCGSSATPLGFSLLEGIVTGPSTKAMLSPGVLGGPSKNFPAFIARKFDNFHNTPPFVTPPIIPPNDKTGMVFDAVFSSPPYADSIDHAPGNKQWEGKQPGNLKQEAYGFSRGQLGALKDKGLDAAISSPPYADSVDGSGEGPGARWDYVHHSADNATKRSSANGYGNGDGNLGAMGAGAAVSSPPYAEGAQHQGGDDPRPEHITGGVLRYVDYGTSPGQLAAESSETFWTAARAIVQQVHAVLRPGGVALWVTGDFVRQGERVYFGKQWLQLCEACGFEPVEWIRCWKREPGPTQLGLLGDDHDHTIDRVSFFRRLANKRNPDAAILNEDVIVMRRIP